MNRRGALRLVRHGGQIATCLCQTHHISILLEVRPCLHPSSGVRSSQRSDTLTGYGILFDTTAFARCSIRDLRYGNRSGNRVEREKRRTYFVGRTRTSGLPLLRRT